MTNRTCLFAFVAAACICLAGLPAFPTGALATQEPLGIQDIVELSIEDLLNVRVVTAGRRSQGLSESPSTVSVITAEDIRQSGATLLPEAFWMTPGVHFGYMSANWPLTGGIRGFHTSPTNKCVLMIDGLPWTYENYALPAVNLLPMSLADIDRVEILKGPGSSMYGPNAMFGVINVFLKKPGDSRGHRALVMAGEWDTLVADYTYSGSVTDRVDLSVHAGWDMRDNPDYIAWKTDPMQNYYRVNTRINARAGSNTEFSLFAGYIYPEKMNVLAGSSGPIDHSGSNMWFATGTCSFKEPNITITGYTKTTTEGAGWFLGQRLFLGEFGSHGVDVQHIFQPHEKLSVVWGANVTQHYTDANYTNGRHAHNLAGIFADTSLSLTDRVTLNGGLRYDLHSLTGSSISHRASLLYRAGDRHRFRVVWGSSYRNPDFIEARYNSTFLYDTVPLELLGLELELPVYLDVSGNADLKGEKAETLELSYMAQLTDAWSLTANLFFSTVKDFIFFPVNELPTLDFERGGLLVHLSSVNAARAQQRGAEMETTCRFTQWLTGTVSYTYYELESNSEPAPDVIQSTPRHMANVQLRCKWTNGWSANASVHYRSETHWPPYTWMNRTEGTTLAGGKADAYVIANLRVGYSFLVKGAACEAAVAAFNLFDKGFDDYPLDTSDIGRRVTGSLRVEF